MNQIGTIFTILTAIFGGVCVMLFVSTKTLRDSRDDQGRRIEFLEAERVRDKEQISELTTAVGFWRSAATGDQKLDALTTLLTEHHGEARKNWVTVTAGLGHVGTAIDHMNDTLDNLAEILGDNST